MKNKTRADKTVRDTDEIGDLENEREKNEQAVFDFDLTLEDSDSKAERNMVYNLDKTDYYKYPLIIKDMRKVYPACGGVPPKVATRNFCLRIKKGEMFGLLGPNGAGKTTLISMLTGMYRPSSGNAWIAGYDIRN
jgi:ABC-type glutathione transport system ATPase component